MKDPRLVVERAILTEKGADLRDRSNQYLFRVAMDANKIDIKRSVEEIFDVTVMKVTTSIRRGKNKRFGRHQGMRPNWKRAVVTLKEGDAIELFDNV